jgi:hypothetical protein
MKHKLLIGLLMLAVAFVAGPHSSNARESKRGGGSSAGGSPPVGGNPPVGFSPVIMPLSEVKPGQIGIVHTVFQGTKVEQFECEVIGVMKGGIGMRKDLILVRLRGQKPEFTGVVAGMSGSPVYVDGRLIGALSYKFGIFVKEPIGGVTPIEYMLEAGKYSEPSGQESPPQRSSSANWNIDPFGSPAAAGRSEMAAANVAGSAGDESLGNHSMRATGWSPTAADGGDAALGGISMMVPIATPLVFSGFDPHLFDRFAGAFRQNNFLPVMGGGAAGDELQDSAFEPGAAISCVLMKGDLSIAGTGTITYRDGDRVLAFGHPMFQSGHTAVPMAKARIDLTLSSSLASTKMATATEIVGSIKEDRLTAIMGQVGSMVRMIPVLVELHPARGETRSYHFEMFEEPFYTPLLLNIALANSMIGSMDNLSVQTINFNGKIDIEGHSPVNVVDVISSEDMDAVMPSAVKMSGEIARAFSAVYTNGMERPRIKGISVRIDQTAERSGAVIEEARADREEVKPGEEFNVAVLLRPYRSETITKIIKLRVPETAERGQELRLMVSDAPSFAAAEGGGANVSIGGRAFAVGGGSEPASLEDLITHLNRARPANAIYVRISQMAPGAQINQQNLPSLPLSMMSVIGSGQTANGTMRTNDAALGVSVEPLGYPVKGNKTLSLIVR